MYWLLHKITVCLNFYVLISEIFTLTKFTEKYCIENPELKSAIPLHYLSHKEQYEETIRRIAVTTKRIDQWNAEGKDPIKYNDRYYKHLLSRSILDPFYLAGS